MNEKAIQIGFLLGSPEISGGTYVIYEHGCRLKQAGYDVSMITEEEVTQERCQWHPGAAELGWLSLEQAGQRSFDLIFATYWKSPFLFSRLKSIHYAYFVQSIESRFFSDPDPANLDERDLDKWKAYCEATYSFNVPMITEARWIRDYLHENYNHEPFLVRNGIRKDFYREDGPAVVAREQGRLRVLVEGPVDVAYKNVPSSVELCRQAGVDEVWLLTSSAIDSFPGVDRVFSRVPIHETPAIYRSCDVLVKLSYVEGMFGPPLEMFHCGGTAIVYEVTGHDEYIVHGRNSYVVAPDDEQQVVDYLLGLKKNAAELQRLKDGARKTAAAWPDWGEAAKQFEAATQQILQQTPPNPAYIKKWIDNRELEKDHLWFLKEIMRFAERERETGEALTDLHNFVQIFSKVGDAPVDAGQVKWFYYRSDEQTTINATLAINGLPFWIRIDPSVRIGVVILNRITVTNLTSGLVLMTLESAEDFDQLFLSGTTKRIGWQYKAALLSYGIDPWFYLPPIMDAVEGDELEITITIKELGITQFANRYSAAPLMPAQPGRPGLTGRLLRRLIPRR